MRVDDRKRLIGRYTGSEKGPLLICIGGIHGNEPAGVKAADLMLKMLEVEPITNPGFTLKGRFVGLLGNIQAYNRNVRFIHHDLNRSFSKSYIAKIKQKNPNEVVDEDRELLELVQIIEKEIQDYQPSKVVILDLHTTSSHGGIFSFVTEDAESVHLAVELHAPVVRGMLKGLHGTTLHYFNRQNFPIDDITTITFESGQHNEILSINRAIAAITNAMRTIGCARDEDVENQHDKLLIEFSEGLPKVAELVTRHDISQEDEFIMQPDFENFQAISKGEWLATDREGKIFADTNGLLLMPLYQKQGHEGFFIIREIQSLANGLPAHQELRTISSD